MSTLARRDDHRRAGNRDACAASRGATTSGSPGTASAARSSPSGSSRWRCCSCCCTPSTCSSGNGRLRDRRRCDSVVSADGQPVRRRRSCARCRWCPLVIGLFWGVPVVARELELRTATLAWSQDVSPRRWLRRAVAVLVALTVVVSGVACLWAAAALARTMQ